MLLEWQVFQTIKCKLISRRNYHWAIEQLWDGFFATEGSEDKLSEVSLSFATFLLPLEKDADVHQVKIWTNLTGNMVDLSSDKNCQLKTGYQSEYWF